MIHDWGELLPVLIVVIMVFTLSSHNDCTVKLGNFVISSIYALYFFTQDMPISSGVMALVAVRSLVSVFTRHHGIGFLFIVLTILIPLVVGGVDYLSIFSGVIGTYSYFWLSGYRMRMGIATASMIWVVNNALNGAYMGAFVELIVMILSLLTAYSLYKRSKRASELAKL